MRLFGNMETYEIVKKMREYTGRTQQEIAHQVDIQRQALQRYEKTGSLPESTEREVCKLLYVDPEYAARRAGYPFKSNDLIKLFMDENILLGESLDPMYFIAGFNKKLSVIYLTIQNIPELTKMDHLIALHKIYAVTFRDDAGNIFLLRRKKENKTINTNEILPTTIHKILSSPCVFSIAHKEITRELFHKIKDWGKVKRKDLEVLYDKSDFETYFKYNHEENEQIESQREFKLDYLSRYELMLIKEIREKGISAEEVSRRIKKG